MGVNFTVMLARPQPYGRRDVSDEVEDKAEAEVKTHEVEVKTHEAEAKFETKFMRRQRFELTKKCVMVMNSESP